METPPVNVVPAATSPTAEEEMAEGSDILYKDSRNQIEQLLLTCLQVIGDNMANVALDTDSDEADGDGTESEDAFNGDGSVNVGDATDGEVSRMMAPEVGESLEPGDDKNKDRVKPILKVLGSRTFKDTTELIAMDYHGMHRTYCLGLFKVVSTANSIENLKECFEMCLRFSMAVNEQISERSQMES
ncbi:hypothetical protein EC968_002143 [Mortierella alpina]|nr:hypothetical protein EC968_002143 [Mortierella alpina]